MFFGFNKSEKNALMLTIEGAIAAIILNLTNPFYSMFARRMGASDYQIGLVSSLPYFIVILTLIPGSIIVDKFVDKKRIVNFFILTTGIMFPLIALSPYGGKYKVIIFIIGISILNFPYSLYNVSWQSFFSEVFPLGTRNVPYAVRTKAATFFGVMTMLVAGMALTYIPHSDTERINLYQIFYVIAFFLSIFQVFFLNKVKNYSLNSDTIQIKPIQAIKSSFINLTKHRSFFEFCIVAFCFHFAWQMAWPLFFIYQVDYLNVNEAWISYLNVANGIASTVMFSFWCKKIDKKGPAQILVIGALGLAFNPVLIILTKSLPIVLIIYIAIGLTFPAFQLALFQRLLELVPQEYKTLNMAIYTTLINISGFVAPIIGVSIYKMTSIYFAMSLSGVLRLIGTFLFYKSFMNNKKE